MDSLGIGPAKVCEIAFKIDKPMRKIFKSDCAVTGQEKSEQKFLKLAEGKKNRFKSKKTAERMRRHEITPGYPDALFTRVRRALRHPDDPPLNCFQTCTAPDSIAYCSG